MTPVKAAAVQAAPVLLDRDETIGKVVAFAEKAAAEGARLVAFPGGCLVQPPGRDNYP